MSNISCISYTVYGIFHSYLFNLDEGFYTVVVRTAPQMAIPKPTKFVFQAIAENIELSQLEKR